MLENIRKIGLFMVAAQAVIHFVPGSQYEKYIKLISSVIILFLFMGPFISRQGDLVGEWQTGMKQAAQRFKEEDLWQADVPTVNERVTEQMEEEVKARLNNCISDREYCVESVSFVYSGDNLKEREDVSGILRVEIVMEKRGEEGIEPVLVKDIVIGDEREYEDDTKESAQYQEIFAKILGIGPDRVEVTCVGGW